MRRTCYSLSACIDRLMIAPCVVPIFYHHISATVKFDYFSFIAAGIVLILDIFLNLIATIVLPPINTKKRASFARDCFFRSLLFSSPIFL